MSGEVNDLADLLARAAAARAAGELAEAERLYGLAVAGWPQAPEPHHHLAGVLRLQDRLELAEAAYRRALALAPGAEVARRGLATILLSQGRFAEGFALMEARHALPRMAKPVLAAPEWRGEPIAGKRLLIWPEQGFGDQIQYARFAPVLRDLGAQVTLLCYPPLARLFRASLGVPVIAAAGAVEFPDPDYWVMQASLPGRMGITVETIPNAPYLSALGPAPELGPGFKVGFKTQGNAAHGNDANRSLPAGLAERLRGTAERSFGLDPQESGAADFADTAAIIAALDLVVSVDTSVAHLAGAMGKPCWVLLPAADTDWRWLRGRTDSPWYPSMRLYRQAPGEGWAPVIARVARDLQRLG